MSDVRIMSVCMSVSVVFGKRHDFHNGKKNPTPKELQRDAVMGFIYKIAHDSRIPISPPEIQSIEPVS